jgi:16S rRNA (guanine966-N2)-methyltransferase
MLDRVRQCLFDILAPRMEGTRVLDLCAGTGSLGLESLSRGAREAWFVESDARNVEVIRANIRSLGLEGRSTVLAATLPAAVRRLPGAYDIVFLDPPFESSLAEETLPGLGAGGILSPTGLVVVQRPRRAGEWNAGGFRVDRRHGIGDSELWFLRKAGS